MHRFRGRGGPIDPVRQGYHLVIGSMLRNQFIKFFNGCFENLVRIEYDVFLHSLGTDYGKPRITKSDPVGSV